MQFSYRFWPVVWKGDGEQSIPYVSSPTAHTVFPCTVMETGHKKTSSSAPIHLVPYSSSRTLRLLCVTPKFVDIFKCCQNFAHARKASKLEVFV